MRDVCNQCRGTVTNRLLHCSDWTAVFHRECVNGHKQHRVTGHTEESVTDTQPQPRNRTFVMIEPCDCVGEPRGFQLPASRRPAASATKHETSVRGRRGRAS